MNKIASLSEVTPDRIRLHGVISVDSVVALQQQGYKILDRAAERTEFDFGDVEIIGSAIIALMIAWQRRAFERELEIAFTHASESLLAIAEISGVKDILVFE